MLQMDVKAEGANRFRRMSNPRGAITKASWAFMRRQGAVYVRYAIQEAPVGKDWSNSGGFNQQGHPGLLKNSHVLRVLNPFNAEIVNVAETPSGDPYPIFVAKGTRPHMPPASSGLPWPVRRKIAEDGTEANPWMDRAFALGNQDVKTNLDQMGAEIIGELVGP